MVVKTNTRTKRICPLDHDKPEIDYSKYPEPPRPKVPTHPLRVFVERPPREHVPEPVSRWHKNITRSNRARWSMSAPMCLACSKENAWVLVSNQYEDICGQCVESDLRVELDTENNVYAIFGYCQGGCGKRNPVNYGRYDADIVYYCGGSPHCTP